jgi:tRNA(adenine34) deaminase
MDFTEIKKYMKLVTRIASALHDEMPIVCLMIKDGKHMITTNIKEKHAEILMINQYDVRDAYVFINIEPCPMCTFALSLAKVRKVFFGAYNPKYGACGGALMLKNHIDYKIIDADGGFYAKENEKILQKFFNQKRRKI